jgi:hypothetical protein
MRNINLAIENILFGKREGKKTIRGTRAKTDLKDISCIVRNWQKKKCPAGAFVNL